MHVKGRLGNAVSLINVFTHLNKFKGFDIVLIISTSPLFRRFFNNKIFDFLIKNNGKVYLSGAGLNANSFDFWHNDNNSKYYFYTQGYLDSVNKKFSLYNNNKLKESELILFNKIERYIPIMYEYAEPFRTFLKFQETIPIPINLSKFNYKTNIVNKKIVFFHGLSRACKGGEFIIKAFEILSKKYPNDADFFCKGGLLFDDYLQLLQKTNVVLDDVNAYSLGMNGLFSMAQGKIVMGGAESLASKELNYSFCPAINLTRDVNQIVLAVESVLENRNSIEEIGYNSRMFVEKHHDHINIAKKYINLWEKNKRETIQ